MPVPRRPDETVREEAAERSVPQEWAMERHRCNAMFFEEFAVDSVCGSDQLQTRFFHQLEVFAVSVLHLEGPELKVLHPEKTFQHW